MATIKSAGYLDYLHSFRGFAILNIVAIHAVGLVVMIARMMGNTVNAYYEVINELLFHSSTIYFAIISGILFSVVLKSRGYSRFYSNKIKNVLFPYIFLTLVFSLIVSTRQNPLTVHTDINEYLQTLIPNFIYGTAQFTFWYIPVLFFLYLVTPVLDRIYQIKMWGPILTLLIVLLPLAISRLELVDMTEDSLSLSTMLYFMGAYAAGMVFGTDPIKWLNVIKKFKVLIISIAILSSIAIVVAEMNEMDKIGVWSLRATLFYIQKMTLAGIAIFVFHSFKTHPLWLQKVADYSFSIYFLHAFFLLLIMVLLFPVLAGMKLGPILLFTIVLLVFVVSILLSMGVSLLLRKIFGKNSRMLVGN